MVKSNETAENIKKAIRILYENKVMNIIECNEFNLYVIKDDAFKEFIKGLQAD